MRCLAKAGEAQDMRRAHIQAFIDKFRFNAKRASLVQSRIKAIERMEVLDEVADDPKWRFEFPDPGALGLPVLQVDDVTFGYTPDKLILKKANFSVDMSSRIAIVGPNGVGKSTLIKLLMGELEPQEGTVIRNPKYVHCLFLLKKKGLIVSFIYHIIYNILFFSLQITYCMLYATCSKYVRFESKSIRFFSQEFPWFQT
jgi:ATPase subunit of ABC transporter with duplicated ATPase domains